MSDNLKTWPEIVRARNWYQNTNNTMQFDAYLPHVEINGEGIVKYIRADIAKEREEKLIAKAYYWGRIDGADTAILCKSCNRPELYKEAGLMELK